MTPHITDLYDPEEEAAPISAEPVFPELDAHEGSWIIYSKLTTVCVETFDRKRAEAAFSMGLNVVTISQHLAAVQEDVDHGGDGSNAKHYVHLKTET